MKSYPLFFLLIIWLCLSSLIAQGIQQPMGYTLQPIASESTTSPTAAVSQITASKYCAFLNAVAASDPHHLYDEKMGSNLEEGCILRSGVVGSYSYSVIQGKEDVPISFFSNLNAMRYCNWQENGSEKSFESQEDINVTEHGSYELQDDQLVAINPNALYLVGSDYQDDQEFGSSSLNFKIINTTAASGLAKMSSKGREEKVAEGAIGNGTIGDIETNASVRDEYSKVPQLNTSLAKESSPLMMFGEGDETRSLKISDPHSIDSRDIKASGATSSDNNQITRGTNLAVSETAPTPTPSNYNFNSSKSESAEDDEQLINNNNKSELKGALVLENFRSALAVNHPSATQLILAEYSNIQPQDKTPQEPLKIGFSERTTSAYMRGMMNSMSGSQINSARESLFSAFPEDRSAIITSASVGQTLEGHNITQVHSQEPKKEGSPDSIALRKSETQGDAGNLFVGRRISFDPALIENKKQEIAREASSKPPGKAITPDVPSDKEFKRGIRQLKKLVTALEIAMDAIDENDPEYLNQIAAIKTGIDLEMRKVLQELLLLAPEKTNRFSKIVEPYETAIPKVKNHLDALLISVAHDNEAQGGKGVLLSSIQIMEYRWILSKLKSELNSISKEEPESSSKEAGVYTEAYLKLRDNVDFFVSAIDTGLMPYDQVAALQLNKSAYLLLEVAFKTFDRNKIEPINTQEDNTFVLTWRNIPHCSLEKITPQDHETVDLIQDSENVVKNLEQINRILNFKEASSESDEADFSKRTTTRADLQMSYQRDKASQASNRAFKNLELAREREECLVNIDSERVSDALVEARIVVKLARSELEKCYDNINKLREVPPLIADPIAVAMEETLKLSREALRNSNQLAVLFFTRKK